MDLKVYALLNEKIKELAGGGLTQAEVEKIVTDEVAKIVAGAPEDFDTLKEMSDWISSHEESAASMNSAIQTNANDISALDTNKVDKVDGKSLISDTEITRLAKVDNYDDSGIKADIQTNADNIDTNKTNILTLKKHVTGDLTDSDFQEDNTAVMTKTVPSGMGDYAAIKVIGGKTVKDEENQVLKNAVVESVVSVSKNILNIAELLTDSTSWSYISLQLKPNTTYTVSSSIDNISKLSIYAFNSNGAADGNTNQVSISIPRQVTTNSDGIVKIQYKLLDSSYSFKNYTYQIEEGSTATEYSPYNKTTLLIPDSDKNLPCFGYGINETVQNIRDYENGTYTQMVAEVDLGDFTWKHDATYPYFFTSVPSDLKIPSSSLNVANIVCSIYKTVANANYNREENKTISISEGGNIGIYDTHYTDTTVFKEVMKGIKLVYELATPVVTDCSDMLMPIRVETGGTITLQNEHSLDMPNTVVYKKEVSLS